MTLHTSILLRLRTAWLCLLSAVLTPPGLALGEEMDCILCHGKQRNRSSVHSTLGCTDCHTDITTLTHAESPAGSDHESCGRCHEPDPRLSTSMHGHLGCQACHGLAQNIPPANETPCADCHATAIKTLALSAHGGIAYCQGCQRGEWGQSRLRQTAEL